MPLLRQAIYALALFNNGKNDKISSVKKHDNLKKLKEMRDVQKREIFLKLVKQVEVKDQVLVTSKTSQTRKNRKIRNFSLKLMGLKELK